jgi:putative ABC transport system permease protein
MGRPRRPRPRRQGSHEPIASPSRCRARDPAQQDALVPHHLGHHHRRRGGHRHGGHRRGRQSAGGRGVLLHGLEHPHRAFRQHHLGRRARRLWEDLKAIRSEATAIRYATPQLRTNAPVISEDQNWASSINGVSPEFFQIRDWPVSLGSGLNLSDIEGGTKVVVLGQTVVENLFGASADPVGQTVRIKKIPFQIVGVLARKGQSAMGQDSDDAVYMPYTTFQAKIQGGLQKFIPGSIMVSAASSDDLPRAQKQIGNLLRDRHHIGIGADDDFSIRNLTEMASAQQEGVNTLTTLLALIAAVSLLVGGIGIMNIMLVSVTERTREIGIRMAVGARPRDVLAQFLVEALTLSFFGGVLGVLAGVAVKELVAHYSGWPTLLRLDIIVIAVVFSGVVGVIFGLYPAYKASRLDPIDALRFE